MKKGLLLVFGTLALAACSQDVPKRAANVIPGKLEVLGVVQLSISSDERFGSTAIFKPLGKISAQDVITLPQFFNENIVLTSTVDDFKNNRRYVTNVFKFKNSSSQSLTNAVLVAFAGNTVPTNTGNSTLLGSTYYTIGGTNLAEIRSVGVGPTGPIGVGQTGQRLVKDVVAQCIKPAHAVRANNLVSPTNTLVSPTSSGTVGVDYLEVDPNYADLQFLQPSEVTPVQSYLDTTIPTEKPRALNYGFAIHTDAGSRTVINGAQGTVAVTYAFDRGASTTARPSRYLVNFLVVNQGLGLNITQSFEEQTSSAAVLNRASDLSTANSNGTVSYRAWNGSNPSGSTVFTDVPASTQFTVVTADTRTDGSTPGTTGTGVVTLGQYVNCYQ